MAEFLPPYFQLLVPKTLISRLLRHKDSALLKMLSNILESHKPSVTHTEKQWAEWKGNSSVSSWYTLVLMANYHHPRILVSLKCFSDGFGGYNMCLLIIGITVFYPFF